MRRIFTCALTVIFTAFLWLLFSTVTVYAATDASWSGSNISYQSHTFNEKTSDGTNPPGLASGTKYYIAAEVTDNLSGSGVADIIYFDGAAPTATQAHYEVFNVDNSGKYGSKVSGPTTITITPQSASASATKAAWDGSNLLYNGGTYSGSSTGPFIANGSTPQGMTKGTQYYLSLSNQDFIGNATAYTLAFPSGSTPGTQTKATYQEYNVDSSGKMGDKKGSSKSVDVTPAASSPSGTTASQDPGAASTCKIDGIGWIVCPISNFLAKGMDNVFNMLQGFMVVKPLTTDTGSLYQAWSAIRNIANIAFVIVFIVIIYSQLTSMGISNYGIKKLLPRLITAAILVNVSYWICAIAVDLSNIVGSGLEQLLITMRTNMQTPNSHSLGGWASMTTFILSGGALGAAAVFGGVILVASTGASIGAAVILLLPMLLSLLLAVLVALLVLAARQAVITLLVIVAPLAFVAFLLPNTEKWFDKWKDTFITLLIFFPLFALVFGGSQLAAFLIIQNTDQVSIVLLGMFVQVAPLVLTPILVKFSGSVVGRVANMVNNPNKGFIDRAKKWSKDRSELMAAQNMARIDPVRRRQIFRRTALSLDSNRRAREARKTMYGAQSDARWTNSAAYSDIDQGLRQANETKQLGESQSELRYQTAKSVNGALQNLDVEVRDVKLRLENAKLDTDINWERNHDPAIAEQKLRAHASADTISALKATHDAEYEEFKAGRLGGLPTTTGVAQMLHQNQQDVETIAVQAMRNASAKRVQQENLTNTISADMDPNSTIAARQYAQMIRQVAGGIQGHDGAQRALAQALSDQHRARADTITNANAIIEHSNLNAEETLRIAQNISVKNIAVTDDIREAAIKRVASNGVIPHINDMLKSIDMSPSGNEFFRLAAVEGLRGNSNKPKYIGLGLLDKLTQGLPGGIDDSTIDSWIKSMLVEGKLSANELVSQDKDTLARVAEAIGRLPRTPDVTSALSQLRLEIDSARSNPQMWDRAGERKTPIEAIERNM